MDGLQLQGGIALPEYIMSSHPEALQLSSFLTTYPVLRNIYSYSYILRSIDKPCTGLYYTIHFAPSKAGNAAVSS